MCSTSSETRRSRTWFPFLGGLAWNETLPGPNGQRQRAVRAFPPSRFPHLLLDSMIPSKLLRVAACKRLWRPGPAVTSLHLAEVRLLLLRSTTCTPGSCPIKQAGRLSTDKGK